MSLQELGARISLNRPTAPVRYGRDISRISQNHEKKVYDGRYLPAFLLDSGGDPDGFRQFLIDNRIGSVSKEMNPGIEVFIKPT